MARWSRSTARSKWTRRRPSREIGSFSGGVIHWQGDAELMKRIQELSNAEQLDRVVEKCLRDSAKPVQDAMDDFMDSHLAGSPRPRTQSTEPRGKGQTKRFMGQWLSRKGHHLELLIGYEKRDYSSGDKRAPEGLAALFLDVGTRDAAGTPRVTPTFFVYYAVMNNLDKVRRIQNDIMSGYIDRVMEGH